LIVCGTAVTDELVFTENAVTTILGARWSKLGIRLFFYAYSGRRDTLFELLSAIISAQDFLLWCKKLPLENALRGLKIGVK